MFFAIATKFVVTVIRIRAAQQQKIILLHLKLFLGLNRSHLNDFKYDYAQLSPKPKNLY